MPAGGLPARLVAGAPPRLTVAGNASADLLLGPLAPWPAVGTEVLVERTAWRTVLKLGPDGAAWLDDGRAAMARAPRVEVADTVGAGDTFDAALLAGLRETLPLADAVELAVAAASRAVASSPRRFEPWTRMRDARQPPGRSPRAHPANRSKAVAIAGTRRSSTLWPTLR